MNKSIYSAVVIMACMLSLGGASAHAGSPNIILILTDDQGWSQLSEWKENRNGLSPKPKANRSKMSTTNWSTK